MPASPRSAARRTPTGKAAGGCRPSCAGPARSRPARSQRIVSHQDWLPTLLAAAGEPEIKEKLLEGHKAGDKTFKVHIDGYNMLPYFTGEAKESPRKFFFYISDDGDILALRMGDWKVVFMEQRATHLQLGRAVREARVPEDLQSAA